MYPFHDALVVPLLQAVQARSVMEIGADQGEHTELLQRWCRTADAHLHIIEPTPSQPLLALLDESVATLHVGTSHDRIQQLPVLDVALIDGDHNHFTVTGEIRRLVAHATAAGAPVPLMLFHDVWWPYGRRDMYYEPDRIPEEHRHPTSTDAIRLGRSELVLPPGFNHGYANARHEGGPGNGVLTAVEDVAATLEGSRLVVLPALHGLAVLAPAGQLADHPPLRALLDQLTASPALLQVLEATEHGRLQALEQVMDEAWAKAHAEVDRDAALARVEGLEQDLRDARAELADLAAQLEVLRAERAVPEDDAARDGAARDAELEQLRAFRDAVQRHPVARARRGALRLGRAIRGGR